MPKSFLFLLLVLLNVFAACHSDKQAHLLMDEAESLMDEHPDSALVLLERVEKDREGFDRKAQGRYSLLHTLARYKSGYNDTLDSQIAPAIAYYQDRENDINRAKAYYCAGNICGFRKDYTQALLNYLHAEKTARDLKDSLQLGLIYRGMADVFDVWRDGTTALKYYQKSLACFMAYKDESYTKWARYDLGRAYYNLFNSKKCLELADEIYDEAEFSKDTAMLCKACRLKGEIYCLNKELDLAREQYKIIDAAGEKYKKPEDWEFLALIELESRNIPKAKIYNDSLLKYKPKEIWVTYRLARFENNKDLALEIVDESFGMQDSAVYNLVNNTLTNTVFDYYTLQEELADVEIRKERQANLYLFILCLIIFLVPFFVYILRIRRYLTT